jgi:hypothetical protein
MTAMWKYSAKIRRFDPRKYLGLQDELKTNYCQTKCIVAGRAYVPILINGLGGDFGRLEIVAPPAISRF